MFLSPPEHPVEVEVEEEEEEVVPGTRESKEESTGKPDVVILWCRSVFGPGEFSVSPLEYWRSKNQDIVSVN